MGAALVLELLPQALKLVIPQRTSTNRRRYSQRDLLTLQAIQRLTRGHGLNLNGARLVIECLRLLDEHQIPRPKELREVNIEHVRI